MELNKKNFFFIVKFFIFFSLLIFLIFMIQFSWNVNYDDFTTCLQLENKTIELINGSKFHIQYPYQCEDTEAYFKGFINFNSSISEDFYEYETRPLYLILGKVSVLLASFVSLIVSNYSEFRLFFPIIVLQTILVLVTILQIFFIFKKVFKFNNYFLFIISLLLLVSPLIKWGLFTPVINILSFSIFILILNILSTENSNQLSFVLGILMLFYSGYLLPFSILILKNIIQSRYKESIRNIFKFSIPTMIYYFYSLFLNGTFPQDYQAKYYRSFIWIFDLLKKDYEKIPNEAFICTQSFRKNFNCYFQDTLLTNSYLRYILLLTILNLFYYFFKSKKHKVFIKNLLFTTVIIYVFWSLNGWYQPIRFTFYSIGVFITFAFIFFALIEENIFFNSLNLISYTTYFLFINNFWNPIVLDHNFGIVFSKNIIYTTMALILCKIVYEYFLDKKLKFTKV